MNPQQTVMTHEQAQHAIAVLESMPKLDSPTPEVVERVAKINGKGKDKVAADLDYTGLGKNKAKEYIEGLAQAGSTWQHFITDLVLSANDKQREQAMNGAMVYCKGIKGNDFAASALRKRVSESRRIFKAAKADYAATVKIMKGAGAWFKKVQAMPKATKQGAKKKATPEQALASVTANAEQGQAAITAVTHVPERIVAVAVGAVIGQCEQLSEDHLVMVVDWIAAKLVASKNIYHQSLAQRIIQLRAAQEKPEVSGALSKVVAA